MSDFFIFQDTVHDSHTERGNNLQFLEEQDVIVPKKKKKKKKIIQSEAVVQISSDTTSSLVEDSIKVSVQKKLTGYTQPRQEKAEYTTSIFGNHLLIQKDSSPEIRKFENRDLITALILMAVVLIALLNFFSKRKFRENFELFFSGKALTQMMQEERSFMSKVSFLLSLSFLIVVPLFLYQSISFFGINTQSPSPVNLFLRITVFICSLYVVKIIVLKSLSFVFDAKAMMNENIFSLFLFNEMLGIFLLPVVIGIAFIETVSVKYFIYSGFGIWAAAWIYRNFRVWTSRTAGEQVSKFYLMLYLCTLEILPLLMLVKFFKD